MPNIVKNIYLNLKDYFIYIVVVFSNRKIIQESLKSNNLAYERREKERNKRQRSNKYKLKEVDELNEKRGKFWRSENGGENRIKTSIYIKY